MIWKKSWVSSEFLIIDKIKYFEPKFFSEPQLFHRYKFKIKGGARDQTDEQLIDRRWCMSPNPPHPPPMEHVEGSGKYRELCTSPISCLTVRILAANAAGGVTYPTNYEN